MKVTRIVVSVVVALCSTVLEAQAPKPGPEHQKLQVFVGNWTYEGEVKATPFGPAGKVTGTDRVESLGGFFVQRNWADKTPPQRKGINVFGYDPIKKTYIEYGYSYDGEFY